MIFRRIRICVSLVVFCLFLIVFSGSIGQATNLSDGVLFFQFVPSVLKFVMAAGSITSIGFLVVIVLTLLFGRIYCSGLCPLGILQDVLNFGCKKRLSKHGRYRYLQPRRLIRYTILFIVLFAAVIGSLSLVNFIDPYGLFGRIVSHLISPVFYLLNNQFVSGLEFFDIYAMGPIKIIPVPGIVLCISFLCFCVVAYMSLRYGRQYCSSICPVGTLLGLLSRVSLFQFNIDKEQCNMCLQCVKNCKAGCIDNNMTIDLERCVACFNCLSACKQSAVMYTKGRGIDSGEQALPNLSRRRLVIGTATSGIFLMVLGIPLRSYAGKLIENKGAKPIIPPGAVSVSHFAQTCIACHLCVHACRTHVIKPAFMEYGLKGMLQPVMDFNQGKCAYECNECGKVCPTDAIAPLELGQKKLTKIGSVKLIKKLCITHKDHKDCGACIEVCPSHAVYAVLRGNVRYPEIKPGPCIGCGACQFVCPVKSEKAIIVESIDVHLVAEKPFFDTDPQLKKIQTNSGEEFPF